MRAKISKRTVERLKPGEIMSDNEVRGFVARRLPSGTIQYGLRYRCRDTHKRRWLPLGIHGNLTADQARIQAKKYAGAVASERDPLAERQLARQLADRRRQVKSVLDEFLAKHVVAQQLRSEREIRRIFAKYVVPAIGELPIEEVQRSTVSALLDRIVQDNGPVMADRVRAHLSKALSWYEARTDGFRSPIVRGMARTKPGERARSRRLNDDELRTLWQALDELPLTYRVLFKVTLLTAQRRNEVGAMRWDEIAEDVWTIPAEKYKTKKASVVPLSAEVRRLLESLPRRGDYVFGRAGKTPFSGFSKAKAAVDDAIAKVVAQSGKKKPIEAWVIHDLRRTARSLMAACGVRSEIAERVLGHTIKGVEGVYDRHPYIEEKRDALERLAAQIDQITGPSSNVILLKHLAK